ncbi:DUF4168 domain-containing protein [Sphingomonas sp.]
MMTIHRALIASAVLGIASPALAQTAPDAMAPTAPQETAPAAPQEAAPQGMAPAAPVADAEVSSFAKAMVSIDAVQKDATLAPEQKQEKMAAKVQEAGLQPQRFNEIGQAMQADPALQTRVQTAIQAEMGGAEPAQPTQ